MTIEKNNKIYTVKENKMSWTISTKIGDVEVSYNVQKADYPTFESLKAFVAENNLF
mgnify:CR=1 FL=1